MKPKDIINFKTTCEVSYSHCKECFEYIVKGDQFCSKVCRDTWMEENFDYMEESKREGNQPTFKIEL